MGKTSEATRALQYRALGALRRILTALILLVVLLSGGAVMTAYATQSALPGDSLYAVKTGVEMTRAHLARDQVRQVRLYLQFAELRLDEISVLLAQGRSMDIPQATAEFEGYIQKALRAINLLAQNDPVRAAEVMKEVTATLSRFHTILSGMMVSVPPAAQNAMENALSATSAVEDAENAKDGSSKIIDDDHAVTYDGSDLEDMVVNDQDSDEIIGRHNANEDNGSIDDADPDDSDDSSVDDKSFVADGDSQVNENDSNDSDDDGDQALDASHENDSDGNDSYSDDSHSDDNHSDDHDHDNHDNGYPVDYDAWDD